MGEFLSLSSIMLVWAILKLNLSIVCQIEGKDTILDRKEIKIRQDNSPLYSKYGLSCVKSNCLMKLGCEEIKFCQNISPFYSDAPSAGVRCWMVMPLSQVPSHLPFCRLSTARTILLHGEQFLSSSFTVKTVLEGW